MILASPMSLRIDGSSIDRNQHFLSSSMVSAKLLCWATSVLNDVLSLVRRLAKKKVNPP